MSDELVGQGCDAQSSGRLRVVVVDDHEMLRRGLREVIDAQADMEVVGEAEDAAGGHAVVARVRPDVAVLDVSLPDRSGIELCRDVREQYPATHVMMLSSSEDDQVVFEAIEAGADGYVVKHVKGLDLAEHVRRIAHGGPLLDDVMAARVLERARGGVADPRIALLSRRERELLALLAEGKTNAEIADELFLSDKTVKNYVSNVLLKLGMTRRSEVAAFAARVDERRALSHRLPDGGRPVRY